MIKLLLYENYKQKTNFIIMLFLVGLLIIENDGSEIKTENSVLKYPKCLLLRETNNKNITKTSISDYKKESMKNLFKLLDPKLNIQTMDIKNLNLKEMIEFFFKLYFEPEQYNIVLHRLFELLYLKYNDDNFNNFLVDKESNVIIQKLLKEIFDSLIFIGIHDRNFNIFFLKILENFKFKFNILIADSHGDFDSSFLQKLLTNPYLNSLKIKIYHLNTKILEKITSKQIISDEIKNLNLEIHVPINLDPIEKLNNLKNLRIFNKYSKKSEIIIPKIKNLSSLRIDCEFFNEIIFSTIENLKIFELNFINENELGTISFIEYFPNLECIIVRNIDLNLGLNVKKLIKIYKTLKNLKTIDIFVSKRIRKIKDINKLTEKIPHIIIHYDLLDFKYPYFHPTGEIDPIVFYGISVDNLKIYKENFFCYSFVYLFFEDYLPDDKVLMNNICEKSFSNTLYLSNLDFKNEVMEYFRKLKYIKKIILKNVKFEERSFYNFINNFMYDIFELKIYNCNIPKDEFKIIKRIKYLEILTILFPKSLEKDLFATLFKNKSEYHYLKLRVINFISHFENKQRYMDFIYDKLVMIKIYELREINIHEKLRKSCGYINEGFFLKNED